MVNAIDRVQGRIVYDAACCYRCLSAGHNTVPYRSGWTDQAAVWVVDLSGY